MTCKHQSVQKEKGVEHSVILVGLPGCGKSVTGRILAEKLCVAFYDFDSFMEAYHAFDASCYIGTYGLKAYRAREEATIDAFLDQVQKPCLIASGGGTWLIDTFRQKTASWAISIWLDVLPSVISRRPAVATRRLFDRNDDLCESLERLFLERQSLYSQCDLRVMIRNSLSVEEVADFILKRLNG